MNRQKQVQLQDAIEGLQSSKTEDEVRSTLREIFVALGLKQWRLEYQLESGSIDMVNFPARIVVETKRPGVANPHAKTAGPETQFEQLTRYIQGIVDQRSIFESSGEADAWQGYLTDGYQWWGYQWDNTIRKLIPIGHTQGVSVPFETESYSRFVRDHFKRSTSAKDVPPENIAPVLVNPMIEPLRELQRRAESETFYQTKIGLWRNILHGSGIVPSDSSPLNQGDVFLRHSVIVALARILISYLGNSTAPASDLIVNTQDGFQGWIAETYGGLKILTRIAEGVRKYDWRSSTRDVLKEVYHGLIDAEDRREFGEFYTPDKLAKSIVSKTLDDGWCDDAITRAHEVVLGDTRVSTRNLGVLDPSCGSGTFLYHAAHRLLHRISTDHLEFKSKSPEIVARLVHGIDIHPVAVEMAKATLAMALPIGDSGVPNLRVALADAMQTRVQPVFDQLGLSVATPANSQFFVPFEIVSAQNSDSLVEKAVNSVVSGEPLLLDEVQLVQKRVVELAAALKPIVAEEGNHIWVWHLKNAITFAGITREKVGRLIGNPPWLVRNETPEGTRKRDIEQLGRDLKLTPRIRGSSAKGDLAAIFTARVTSLYLGHEAPFNMYAWVLPGSALINQSWERWKSGYLSGLSNIEHQVAWDMDQVVPPIFRHSPNGTCVIFGEKLPPHIEPKSDLQTLAWSGNFELAKVETKKQIERAASDYLSTVERGAFYSPEPLFLVTHKQELPNNLVRVSTKAGSPKKSGGRWFGAEFTDVVLEADTIRPVYRSQDLQPFSVVSKTFLTIATDAKHENFLDPFQCASRYPKFHEFWRQAEERFQSRRQQSSSATLFENLDYRKYLSKQLSGSLDRERRKVIYNKSGSVVRAARIAHCDLAGQTLYYLVLSNEDEALYLCAVLNAPCMQEKFRLSRTSKHDFHKSIFRFTPIPRFNSKDARHTRIVQVALQLDNTEDKDLDRLNRPVKELFAD